MLASGKKQNMKQNLMKTSTILQSLQGAQHRLVHQNNETHKTEAPLLCAENKCEEEEGIKIMKDCLCIVA